MYAVDIDPQAILASRDNVLRNHLPMQAFTIGEPEVLHTLKAELMVANILAAPLLRLRETFVQYITPAGGIDIHYLERLLAAQKV